MKLSRLSLTGLLLFSPTMLSAAARSWSVIETARDSSHRLVAVNAPALAADAAGALTINPAQRFQEMVGFGGALTESSAWVLAQLPPDKRAEVLRRYYDPKDGIGYTLARTHINSCDFSLNMWALDETPGDYDLLDFTLAPMRKWTLPLIHDAIMVLGFLSLTQIEFDLTTVAAILALIGYSNNETIVIFDRVRENLIRTRKATVFEVVNLSVNQTLLRSIITHVTTLLVCVALFAIGGSTVHSFSVSMIVGVIVATYSSIYVSTGLAVALGVKRDDLLPPEEKDALIKAEKIAKQENDGAVV